MEDSNAARAAIASKYIQQCHAIWIVAGIQRAVDDKTARNLLSRSFKQQLHLDGNLFNTTFICSKTDDICFDQAAESLGLRAAKTRVHESGDSLEQWERVNEGRLSNNKSYINTLSTYSGEIDKYLSKWEKLDTSLEDGEIAEAPIMTPRKRKAISRTILPRKRQRADTAIEEKAPAPESTNDLLDRLLREAPRGIPPGTVNGEQARAMIEYLRSRKGAAIEDREALEDQILADEQTREKLEEALYEAESDFFVSCIRARNDYARQGIRQDFTIGAKEYVSNSHLYSTPSFTLLDYRRQNFKLILMGIDLTGTTMSEMNQSSPILKMR